MLGQLPPFRYSNLSGWLRFSGRISDMAAAANGTQHLRLHTQISCMPIH
jgi:hypothetical protein